MKTTIEYPTHDPDRYMKAMQDIADYLGKGYKKTYSIFLEEFNPCTWTLNTFHFYLGMYGIEGFPCQAFAWSIMADWEATH